VPPLEEEDEDEEDAPFSASISSELWFGMRHRVRLLAPDAACRLVTTKEGSFGDDSIVHI